MGMKYLLENIYVRGYKMVTIIGGCSSRYLANLIQVVSLFRWPRLSKPNEYQRQRRKTKDTAGKARKAGTLLSDLHVVAGYQPDQAGNLGYKVIGSDSVRLRVPTRLIYSNEMGLVHVQGPGTGTF